VIADREEGDYKVFVTPDGNADPLDQYSLQAFVGGDSVIIVENAAIASIPVGGIHSVPNLTV